MCNKSQHIRLATAEDASDIQAIYAPYVLQTAITFEYAVPSVCEFEKRIDQTLENYPYLIYEKEGKPVGYAYAGRVREREAYDWIAELSVYIQKDMRGEGIGPKLYRGLMALLEKQGVQSVYGCVTLPNPASEKLHAIMGFRNVGVWPQSGYKLGKWQDVGWFEKRLKRTEEPEKVITFPKLDQQMVEEILNALT